MKTTWNDVTELSEAVTTYVKWMRSDKYHEDEMNSYENDIFEKAVEFLYGKGIWEEISKIMSQ